MHRKSEEEASAQLRAERSSGSRAAVVVARAGRGPLCWPEETAGALADALEDRSLPVLAFALDPRDEDPITAASALFARALRETWPAWLPEAEGLAGAGGAGEAAVRVVARELAARTPYHGPMLEAAAAAALGGRLPDLRPFSRERALDEAVALLLRAFGSAAPATAPLHLVVDLPSLSDEVSDEVARRTTGAVRWLSERRGLVVWLAGPGSGDLPVLPVVRSAASDPPPATPARTAEPRMTPISGRPAPFSRAEQALEAALARCPWAADRAWNRSWAPSPVHPGMRIDLFWEAAGLAVELDGPDHLRAEKYADDRRRDRALQQAGHAVLRFTNDEVGTDVGRVVEEIRALLARRTDPAGRGTILRGDDDPCRSD